ncbi:MAG: enoyl-[acyl-carrier-protein] reductase FabK [Clostridiales Family XIII bacterium]|nr:enoyl-[acyl-carrier-protein] reductase FabK [Clostridiales Family XIII bacterium]
MMKDITGLLGVRYPIIQGAMAWVAEHRLAAAVSNGGGLGLIAGGSADADFVRGQIQGARALTDKPFGVNIMLMSPFADDLMQLAIDEKVRVVTTGAGNPGKYIEALKAAGIVVIPVVASAALAKRMERAGADAVVAEGSESGGHIGEITTMNLVPQVADAVSIPVIAAGGIADGRGAAAAFMLGAKGVQVGTRFLSATEAVVAQSYKDRIIAAGDTDTVVTGRFTGHPVRVLRNKLAREMLSREKVDISVEEFEGLMSGTLRKAVVDGDADYGSLMAGQSAGLVKKEQPAAEIISEIMDGMREVYAAQGEYLGMGAGA